MDFRTRREHYNRCDPDEALDPDDPRNLDVDGLPERIRGDNWTDRLATSIQLSKLPVLRLFTGLPGSGKSTELRRLACRLRDPHTSNLLVVYIDGQEVLDLRATLDVPDVLAAVVDGCERTILAMEGRDVDKALREGYLKRLWSWLTTTEVGAPQFEVSLTDSTKLLLEMRANPTFRQQVRQIVARNLTAFLANVDREVRQLDDRARAHGHQGMVVLFDSLEKLQGATTNEQEVLMSAQALFSGGAPHLTLPVHVLYTVPVALISRQLVHVDFMPTIKLYDRHGVRFTPGLDAAKSLVYRRASPAVLEQSLGPECGKRLEELIDWSGGYPRELVRLLREVFLSNQMPLDEASFRRILAAVKDGYSRIVRGDDCEWLAQVGLDHVITTKDEAQQHSADRMLTNNAVLRYLNESEWFDLHPAVRVVEGVADAIARRLAARTASVS